MQCGFSSGTFKRIDMEKINLAWCIIWGTVFIFSVLAIFFNFAHIFTVGISALFLGMFIHDYIKEKKLK